MNHLIIVKERRKVANQHQLKIKLRDGIWLDQLDIQVAINVLGHPNLIEIFATLKNIFLKTK